ncbi:hypothetical protein PSHT_10387 [Puccinia striiformis]|uniref:Uncharacterized protein n=1 Tax=Puccinia striiformis TaxID=27350 RepID=A0A2S4VA83_9BASI|nr:hypothetical protein PSHT_10387 [Puccinia striiformis]
MPNTAANCTQNIVRHLGATAHPFRPQQTVKRNSTQYPLPLKVLSYNQLLVCSTKTKNHPPFSQVLRGDIARLLERCTKITTRAITSGSSGIPVKRNKLFKHA